MDAPEPCPPGSPQRAVTASTERRFGCLLRIVEPSPAALLAPLDVHCILSSHVTLVMAFCKLFTCIRRPTHHPTSTAESCAKTCVRLSDMVKLLDDMAVAKIKEDDEDGARAVLKVGCHLR